VAGQVPGSVVEPGGKPGQHWSGEGHDSPFQGLLRDGRLGSVRIGASRRISMDSIEAYVAQLMATDSEPDRTKGPSKVTTAGHNGRRPRSRRSNASSPCGEVLALPFAGEVPPATAEAHKR
jgi:hypothetical protein